MIRKSTDVTVKEIMAALKSQGSDSIKKILLKHGVKEPFFGVKVEYLKEIHKKIKKDYQLAKDLYATGNADAMYLAGLIADDQQMTVKDLNTWISQASSRNISEYTVPWVAAEGKHGYAVAKQWIDSEEENIAAAGWATLANMLALKDEAGLEPAKIKTLLSRAVKEMPKAKERVKHQLNAFVIASGTFVPDFTDEALIAAQKIATANAKDENAGKLPDAVTYIATAKAKGSIGKKKKTVKC